MWQQQPMESIWQIEEYLSPLDNEIFIRRQMVHTILTNQVEDLLQDVLTNLSPALNGPELLNQSDTAITENPHPTVPTLSAYSAMINHYLPRYSASLASSTHSAVTRLVELERVRHEQILRVVPRMVNERLAAAQSDLQKLYCVTEKKVKEILATEKIHSSAKEMILESEAIRACALKTNMPFLEMLLEMIVPSSSSDSANALLQKTREKAEILNRFDSEGMTPLMVAASLAGCSDSEEEHDDHRDFCQRLIQMGANQNLVKLDDGLSALGIFRLSFQRYRQDTLIHHSHDSETISFVAGDRGMLLMEALLKPAGGATPADRAIRLDDIEEIIPRSP